MVKSLGSTLSEFFAAEERQDDSDVGMVFRADQLANVVAQKGFRFLGLPGHESSRVIQLLYETYAPKYGDSGDVPYSHIAEPPLRKLSAPLTDAVPQCDLNPGQFPPTGEIAFPGIRAKSGRKSHVPALRFTNTPYFSTQTS